MIGKGEGRKRRGRMCVGRANTRRIKGKGRGGINDREERREGRRRPRINIRRI